MSQRVLDAAFDVHTEIGPGCFERVYEVCLSRALSDQGLRVERQVAVPLVFRGETLAAAFRADLVVDDSVIVEIKAIREFAPVHHAQLRTYVALARKPVGLLLNFGAAHLRDGYDRIVHDDYYFLPPSRGRSLASGPRVLGSSGAAPQGEVPHDPQEEARAR